MKFDRPDKRFTTHACTTGKRGYFSRSDARVAARKVPGGRLRAYPCDACGYWHIGHLAPGIIHGRIGRRELYSREGARDTPDGEVVA